MLLSLRTNLDDAGDSWGLITITAWSFIGISRNDRWTPWIPQLNYSLHDSLLGVQHRHIHNRLSARTACILASSPPSAKLDKRPWNQTPRSLIRRFGSVEIIVYHRCSLAHMKPYKLYSIPDSPWFRDLFLRGTKINNCGWAPAGHSKWRFDPGFLSDPRWSDNVIIMCCHHLRLRAWSWSGVKFFEQAYCINWRRCARMAWN